MSEPPPNFHAGAEVIKALRAAIAEKDAEIASLRKAVVELDVHRSVVSGSHKITEATHDVIKRARATLETSHDYT